MARGAGGRGGGGAEGGAELRVVFFRFRLAARVPHVGLVEDFAVAAPEVHADVDFGGFVLNQL